MLACAEVKSQKYWQVKIPPKFRFINRPSFQLIINTKAAQQIGLDLPPILLARADEVIE